MVKVIAKLKSLTSGLSGQVVRNTWMENLVEFPDGHREYLTTKEIEKLNKKTDEKV